MTFHIYITCLFNFHDWRLNYRQQDLQASDHSWRHMFCKTQHISSQVFGHQNWYLEQLWIRDRARVSLSEGRWIDSPGLHVEVSLGKILNPKLVLVCWSAPCMAATTISGCIDCCKSLWTKASAKYPTCKCILSWLIKHYHKTADMTFS